VLEFHGAPRHKKLAEMLKNADGGEPTLAITTIATFWSDEYQDKIGALMKATGCVIIDECQELAGGGLNWLNRKTKPKKTIEQVLKQYGALPSTESDESDKEEEEENGPPPPASSDSDATVSDDESDDDSSEEEEKKSFIVLPPNNKRRKKDKRKIGGHYGAIQRAMDGHPEIRVLLMTGIVFFSVFFSVHTHTHTHTHTHIHTIHRDAYSEYTI
jgi:hypothetical protein